MEQVRKTRGRQKKHTVWYGIPANFSPIGYVGFVYRVLYDGRLVYVGKKNFWTTKKVIVPGKKRKDIIPVESDWKTYKSSSKPLKALIGQKGEQRFTFIITYLARTKTDLTYYEVKEQFETDAIISDSMLNDCILNKFFRGRVSLLKSQQST